MKKNRNAARPPSAHAWQGKVWEFRLYVAGESPRSIAAIENLDAICREHIRGRYKVEVIDLVQHPERARADQVIAIPTLVRQAPRPVRRVIGDLSDRESVLASLQVNAIQG